MRLSLHLIAMLRPHSPSRPTASQVLAGLWWLGIATGVLAAYLLMLWNLYDGVGWIGPAVALAWLAIFVLFVWRVGTSTTWRD